MLNNNFFEEAKLAHSKVSRQNHPSTPAGLNNI